MEARINRAKTQPLYVIWCDPEELVYRVTGATNNIHNVSLMTYACSCPDYTQRKQPCKHMLFVLLRRLRIDEDDVRDNYIEGFLYEDLITREIDRKFGGFVDLLSSDDEVEDEEQQEIKQRAAIRKEVDGVECGICCDDMSKDQETMGELVFCDDTCGNAIHRTCYQRLCEVTKNNTPPCIYCRTPLK